MAIKVNIPSGQNTATVSGLYQWDYGQVLEIESTDLGSIVAEVHFACSSMSEAVVRPCTFSSGIGTVAIPDECLEQSSTISAWVYEISGTQGRTRKVITIYVTARTRPSVAQDIPTEISNRYTELITEVNEAVDKLENGDVVAKKATEADRATTATSAGNASTAAYALSAGSADVTTPKPLIEENKSVTSYEIKSTGIYAVRFQVFEGEGFSLIAIPDLDVGTYYGTRISNCVPYKGAAQMDVGPVFTTTDDLLVVWGGRNLPILGLYKIADI